MDDEVGKGWRRKRANAVTLGNCPLHRLHQLRVVAARGAVVLLEDIGAEIGLCLALFGVLMSHFTNEPRWDAVGSASIGVLLIAIAIVLAIEMKSLLIGESASVSDEGLIRTSLANAQDVLQVIHLRTEHLGPEDVLVAAKIEFSPHLNMQELATAIDNAEASVRGAYPRARIIFIEPDIARPTAAL
jgi:divalent metal cation (Fe/Co/Zn/Cd) transporter